jgi:chitinase
MARGELHYLSLAAIAALVLLVHGAAAQTRCSATKACAVKTKCCSEFGFCGTGSAYCGGGCINGPCTTWARFLTKSRFESFFPNRLALYSYENLKTATKAPYTKFGNSGSLVNQKREVAAFLANVQQESGGLQFVEEINKSDRYCDKKNKQYPCDPGKKYYGRGALQLTWNYNYGACGAALKLNLLANPDQVAKSGVLAYKTALWFWMTQGPHDRIMKNSFSGTIRAINGNLECGKPKGSLGNNQMLNRVNYYKKFCRALGVTPGTDLTC